MKRNTLCNSLLFVGMMFVIYACEKENEIPVVTTTFVGSITPTTATASGSVTSNGGSAVTATGVCWSTDKTPTIADNTSIDDANKGEFSTKIDGLSPKTTYYLRAYATNKYGTAYGNTISFTTENPTIPTLETTAITGITNSAALCGGNIIYNGGAMVTARGVCWSQNEPRISDSKTTDGSGEGDFTSVLSDLIPGTTYYVRAYATNRYGTAYGNIMYFTTQSIPELSTIAASGITPTTATSGGSIYNNGGAKIIARGVCWSTEEAPTISDNKSTDGSGDGQYSSFLNNLSPETKYYLRAYATNSLGTGYGNTVVIQTHGSFIDSRDNNIYSYVTIGNQVWMAENLKYLPTVNKPNEGSLTNPHYYVNGYDGTNITDAKANENYDIYGVLYNWPAASNDVCPAGWHLPSEAEWAVLRNNGGGAKSLKEIGPEHWGSNNTDATNLSGFTALPGGVRSESGSFYMTGGNWWSSKEMGSIGAASLYMGYSSNSVQIEYVSKEIGKSVRCIRD